MGYAKLSTELWPRNRCQQAVVSQEDLRIISSEIPLSGVPGEGSSSGCQADRHRMWTANASVRGGVWKVNPSVQNGLSEFCDLPFCFRVASHQADRATIFSDRS
jgi:hypothetical protein